MKNLAKNGFVPVFQQKRGGRGGTWQELRGGEAGARCVQKLENILPAALFSKNGIFWNKTLFSLFIYFYLSIINSTTYTRTPPKSTPDK
jgi:hypothetical protein